MLLQKRSNDMQSGSTRTSCFCQSMRRSFAGLDTRATMDMDAASKKRGSSEILKDYKNIIDVVRNSDAMIKQWRTYQKDCEDAADINFDEICDAVVQIKMMRSM